MWKSCPPRGTSPNAVESADAPVSRSTGTGLRLTIFAAAALAIVGLVSLLAWGLSTKEPVTGRSGLTLVDRPAPDFALSTFDGQDLALSELAGSPIVINFWASWCFPCREEARGLERTWREYQEQGVVFIGVAVQDQEQGSRSYLSEFDVTYANAPDLDGTVSVDYGIVGMPATFFVNRKGIIEGRWVGSIPELRLLERVDALATGRPLPGDAEAVNQESVFELDR